VPILITLGYVGSQTGAADAIFPHTSRLKYVECEAPGDTQREFLERLPATVIDITLPVYGGRSEHLLELTAKHMEQSAKFIRTGVQKPMFTLVMKRAYLDEVHNLGAIIAAKYATLF
jgi:hypothetical protein